MVSQTKSLKLKSSLSFNFAITKIFVAIRLAEDGTRMGGIYSFNYPLVSWKNGTYSVVLNIMTYFSYGWIDR